MKVQPRSQWKFQFRRLCKWACKSSGDPGDRYIDNNMARDLGLLAKALEILAIAYLITILLCVVEFTIGIKKSIKTLFMSHE